MSYYPSMIIEHGFVPEHLGTEFLEVYKGIKKERFIAKKNGNKVVNETLKLALNGAYGNMNNEHSFLYDPKQVISICYNGQLMLLMLIEGLTNLGCTIISANTDGITAIVPKELEPVYYDYCKKWEIETKLTLEYAYYNRIVRLAVNDYLAVFDDGLTKEKYDNLKSNKDHRFIKDTGLYHYVKEKGTFITEARLGKGLSSLVIPKALESYFLADIPISDYIKNHNDIKDFLMFEKTGRQWTVEYLNKKVQNINRFYASMNGAYLYKWKINEDGSKQYQNMLKNSGITIINDFDKYTNITNCNINYNYYISETTKLINEIKPKQLKLELFETN